MSLVDHAHDLSSIELVLGFDNDDVDTIEYFKQTIQPELDTRGIDYQAHEFDRMGYLRLNEYVNTLARCTDADWLVFWNDDAIMETSNWDSVISSYTGQFKLLAFHTHNDHPYSIFPILPKEWLEVFGYISPHSLTDAWTSQVAYLVDIWERINVDVIHDRHDLTGNNKDETFLNRPMLEGNPKDPRDFHHPRWEKKRMQDAKTLAVHLESKGLDVSFFKAVLIGTQNPWEKLIKNDVNKQMTQWKKKL